MQSCLEYHHQQHHHHQQGSPHVTFRQYSPHSSSPPQPIKEEEPSGALTTASPASGSGGGVPAVSSGGGGFYGSPHCYLPATKKGDSLPRLGMLGGSTPGMYSVNTPFTLLPRVRIPILLSRASHSTGGAFPYPLGTCSGFKLTVTYDRLGISR
ncbi:hypothetical protein AVEN_231008-1 [Araneus ventricosus]|uniref:Uncharacterized protein n=1 Tax=Araneus ventricosus TaxID=182803 RepID=A0A4Y2A350_ARAVE|nr:hypothetical protein AVEN_231008-1 [Araneus ventricosus]